MKMILVSQFEENYGAHDWDGTGVCPSYWKSKGGSEYQYDLTLREALDLGGKGLNALASKLASQFEHSNNHSNEYLVDWYLIQDNELTEVQKMFVGETYQPTIRTLSL